MIELAVALAIISILAAILTPMVTNYIDQSRMAAAQADARAIADAISNFEKDVGRYPMFTTGTGLLQDSSANVVRLEGPGSTPTESVTTAWTSATPADADCTSGCQADLLVNQLLANSPAYATTTSLAKPFKWKGPSCSFLSRMIFSVMRFPAKRISRLNC